MSGALRLATIVRRNMATAFAKGPFYLGLDSSTQGLKATLVTPSLEPVATAAVNYDRDLPQFNTTSGVLDRGNGVVTTPSLMLAAALDMVMDKLKSEGVDFGAVRAVSGSGQQHGSVYWAKSAGDKLRALNPEQALAPQLENCFSVADGPIWMDSSTGAQCATLEENVGGPQAMAELTGSRCYERFTANQILKKVQEEPEAMENTERISLVSSAMCSLFLGDYAPIDTSDGAGMNLMNLWSEEWAEEVVAALGGDIEQKLGKPLSAYSVTGTIGPYFQKRYGFDPSCRIVPWSGDNPNSLAGLGLSKPGDVGVSLGTSDTIFSIVDKTLSKPGLEGHFFPNPVDPNSHMVMLCYKNGSLSREAVAKRAADGDWGKFAEHLQNTPPGNNGYVGFFVDRPEIIPHIPKTGIRRFDPSDNVIESFPDVATEARAVLEAQFMSMRVHGEALGMRPKTIIVTGGASQNTAICQVLADVFGCEVSTAVQPDSASLGAAYRAMHAVICEERGEFVPYVSALDWDPVASHHTVATPNGSAHEVYSVLCDRYAVLEERVVSGEV